MTKKFKNLKSFDVNQSRDEAVKNGRKGGIKSGEVRRERKKLREDFEILLSLSENGQTNQEKMCLALFEKALKGDVSAFNAIRDLLGEKPKDVIEQTNTNLNTESNHNLDMKLLQNEKSRDLIKQLWRRKQELNSDEEVTQDKQSRDLLTELFYQSKELGL